MRSIELKRGDACPNCGGVLQAARALTADEYRRTFDREQPLPVPSGVDTASPEQREELGDLFTCARCGYKARFASTPEGVPDRHASDESARSGQATAAPSSGQAGTDARPPANDASAAATPSGPASSPHDELARLQQENARLRAQIGGGAAGA